MCTCLDFVDLRLLPAFNKGGLDTGSGGTFSPTGAIRDIWASYSNVVLK